MATLTSLTTNYFATPKEGFTTTLSSTISLGATTVPLNSITGYTNGAIITLVVDPSDPTKKQVFTGVVDTAGVQVTSVVWTEGTDQSHTTGATVVDYVTATHMAAAVKGLIQEHTQSGTHSTTLITARTEDTNPDPDADYLLTYDASAGALKKVLPSNLSGGVDGWTKNVLPSVSSVTYNGNRSYDVTFGSTVASYLTPGMRVRTSRTSSAPTQCADLESGSSQYFNDTSVSGMTFTDDFVVSAWIKLESYASMTIASRYNGTSGWSLQVAATGQVQIAGFNGGAGNYSLGLTYQSLPLSRWVHIAAQLDMSAFTATTTTSYVMIDGVDVPISVSRAGTNPTALIQAGNLEIGAANGGTFFDGKIAQVAIYSAKVTQANIRATISQGLTGSETSLVSAYSFNNSINDLNANANNLTAQNSAAATNSDSPFSVDANGTPGGTYDYGIVTKVSTTTATIQCAEGTAIPTSGGVSAVDLSSVKVPYGFPANAGRWRVVSLYMNTLVQASPAANTTYNLGGASVILPIGGFLLGYQGNLYESDLGAANTGVSSPIMSYTAASASPVSPSLVSSAYVNASGATNTELITCVGGNDYVSVSSATPVYMNVKTNNAIDSIQWYPNPNVSGSQTLTIYADLALL